MDCPFQAGEVVHLRAGGPPMTVEEVLGDTALCSWVEKRRHKARAFPWAALAPGPGDG